jgi:hypothetical protein
MLTLNYLGDADPWASQAVNRPRWVRVAPRVCASNYIISAPGNIAKGFQELVKHGTETRVEVMSAEPLNTTILTGSLH